MHLTLIPNRLWFNTQKVGDIYAVGIQHRIAPPGNEKQTCHHMLIKLGRRIGYKKDVV